MQPRGLSLVELLIAAAITGILLSIVTYGIQSASSGTQTIQTQQLLTEDLRTAGNLITDELSQAHHIYAPGVAVTLNTTLGYTTLNPRTGNQTWTVGTDPIIAAILPPENPAQAEQCSTIPSGCLRLVAYYALPRSSVVANTSGSPDFIGSDSQNPNAWVLFRYLTRLDSGDFSRVSSRLKVADPDFSGSRGELLADFIQPNQGFAVDWSAGGSSCAVSEVDSNGVRKTNPRADCPATGNLKSVTELVFSLRGQMIRGRAILVPAAEPLVFRGTPRNLSLEAN